MYFHQTKKHNVSRKAMHVLFKRIRNLIIPIDLQLYLFDNVILPVALYGCEIWGFENIYFKLLKIYTNISSDRLLVREKVPIYICRIGTSPNTNIYIKTRMTGFWLSIANGKESKLSKLLYTRNTEVKILFYLLSLKPEKSILSSI